MDGLPLGNSGSHDTNANSPGASANDGGATIFGRMFRTESPTSSGSAIREANSCHQLWVEWRTAWQPSHRTQMDCTAAFKWY